MNLISTRPANCNIGSPQRNTVFHNSIFVKETLVRCSKMKFLISSRRSNYYFLLSIINRLWFESCQALMKSYNFWHFFNGPRFSKQIKRMKFFLSLDKVETRQVRKNRNNCPDFLPWKVILLGTYVSVSCQTWVNSWNVNN